MPTAGREHRREQRIETAQRWGTWLTTAMNQARLEPRDIINRAAGAIDKGSLSRWMHGENTASVEGALIVARILDRDPVEALRAAGHDAVADHLAQSVTEAATRARVNLETELRRHVAGLDDELDARLAKYLSAGMPQQGEEEGGRDAHANGA